MNELQSHRRCDVAGRVCPRLASTAPPTQPHTHQPALDRTTCAHICTVRAHDMRHRDVVHCDTAQHLCTHEERSSRWGRHHLLAITNQLTFLRRVLVGAAMHSHSVSACQRFPLTSVLSPPISTLRASFSHPSHSHTHSHASSVCLSLQGHIHSNPRDWPRLIRCAAAVAARTHPRKHPQHSSRAHPFHAPAS
jgi:hypothetical protein